MIKLKNSIFEQTKKTQIVMKLKNSNCEKKKNQIVMKLINLNGDKTQKLKL